MQSERYESGKEREVEEGLNVGVGVEDAKMMRRVVLKMDVRCVGSLFF
jgi:hypothetical protein